MPSFFIAMNEQQTLVHYESQIEVLQNKLEEMFKSIVEKDVVILNYRKSADQYNKTVEGLKMKLQEFEGAQENQIAAVESRNARIQELEEDLEVNKNLVQKQREELGIAQDQVTIALKEYDEQRQRETAEELKEYTDKITTLQQQLEVSKGDNNVEIQNLRKSTKDFEVANRNNLQALNKANAELSALKEETVSIRENAVQNARITSQLTELKGQQQAKIQELSDQLAVLNSELEEARKPKPVVKATTTSRRRKSAASKQIQKKPINIGFEVFTALILMAAPKIQLRRSSVSGRVPTTLQLQLGELAINTYDGRLYIKQDTGGVGVDTSVILVNPWMPDGSGIEYTGDVNIGAALTVTGDVTANAFIGDGSQLTGLPSGGLWASDGVGIHTTAKVGVGTETANSAYDLHVVGSGQTALFVEGGARVSGMFSVGENTITLD